MHTKYIYTYLSFWISFSKELWLQTPLFLFIMLSLEAWYIRSHLCLWIHDTYFSFLHELNLILSFRCLHLTPPLLAFSTVTKYLRNLISRRKSGAGSQFQKLQLAVPCPHCLGAETKLNMAVEGQQRQGASSSWKENCKEPSSKWSLEKHTADYWLSPDGPYFLVVYSALLIQSPLNTASLGEAFNILRLWKIYQIQTVMSQTCLNS